MTFEAIAAVAYPDQPALRLETVVIDALQANEVLVDVKACGICHTDSKFRAVLPLPAVFGHEGSGTVAAIGEKVQSVRVGDRVVMSYPFCNQCPHCLAGEPFKCENIPALKFSGKRLDGSQPLSLSGRPISSAFFQQSSFATRAVCIEDALVKLDTELPYAMLAALPCGIQTGAGAVLNTFAMTAGQSLLVIGAGAVGLAAVMAARAVGVKTVICVEPIVSRLQLALELGATHAINPHDASPVDDIRHILPRGVACVLEASATEAGLKLALQAIGQGGRVGIVSYPLGGKEFPFTTRELFLKAGSLQGIIQGSSIPRQFIPRLIEMYRKGCFPFDRLVTTYAFADINQALADAESGEAIKPVLVME